jgi:hypothetical protein
MSVEEHDVPRAAPRPPSSLLGPEPQAEPENFDAFAHSPPFRPRRNWGRILTVLGVIAAALMLSATAAILYYGLPGTAGKFGVTEARGTPLRIEGNGKRDRMESGNELLTVTGTITNPTETVQPVPPIRAELRDAQGRPVYTWPISAPVPELQPGATTTFSIAQVDVPRGATTINLSFGPAS